MITLKINNSYTTLSQNIAPEVLNTIAEVLTYRNDIGAEVTNLMYQMNMARSQKNFKRYYALKAEIEKLKENEFVCLLNGHTFPTGLMNLVTSVLDELSITYTLDDNREIPDQSVILRWQNRPWPPRYYQKEMIDLGIKHGRGVFEAAVGSGKSLVMAYLIKELSVRTLVIVPSKGLSAQIYNEFSTWFGHDKVEALDAQKIRKLKSPKSICIVTAQSLASLKKSDEFAKFAEWFDAVCVDEVHHAGASTYTSLLDDLDHVYYRFGFSGTFLRNDEKTLEMWSFLSNVLYEFPAHRAISEGFLTPLEYRSISVHGKRSSSYQKEYDNCYSANPDLLDKLGEICKLHEGSQILILVAKKDKVGHIINEYLKMLKIECQYINGDDSKDVITNTIDAFNEKKFNVLIGSSVISEGIDIRSTDVLVNCKGGKSEIDLVQSIGRLIRLYDGKSLGIYYDFLFKNSKFLKTHHDERLSHIKDNFKPTNIFLDL